jgi:hypothetical protein
LKPLSPQRLQEFEKRNGCDNVQRAVLKIAEWREWEHFGGDRLEIA